MSAETKITFSRPRGRKSLYNPAYCERVLELAAEGCGKAEIAAALAISSKTLNAWIKLYGDFDEAMKHAKDLEYAWWLAAGRKGQFDKTWNATSWVLQMRNRFGSRFRDRVAAQRENAPRMPRDNLNAAKLRDEMERKLSRLADTASEKGIPVGLDSARAGESHT